MAFQNAVFGWPVSPRRTLLQRAALAALCEVDLPRIERGSYELPTCSQGQSFAFCPSRVARPVIETCQAQVYMTASRRALSIT